MGPVASASADRRAPRTESLRRRRRTARPRSNASSGPGFKNSTPRHVAKYTTGSFQPADDSEPAGKTDCCLTAMKLRRRSQTLRFRLGSHHDHGPTALG